MKDFLRFLFVMLGAAVLGLIVSSRCDTTRHKDSVGVIMQQTNPYTYEAGSVTNVEFAGNPENYGMVIRIQPLGTYTLYTDDILLCADPSELFAGHHNPMVIVYETVSHHLVGGIGCHELKAVRDIVPLGVK